MKRMLFSPFSKRCTFFFLSHYNSNRYLLKEKVKSHRTQQTRNLGAPFSPTPMSSPSANPVGSTFRINPDSNPDSTTATLSPGPSPHHGSSRPGSGFLMVSRLSSCFRLSTQQPVETMPLWRGNSEGPRHIST